MKTTNKINIRERVRAKRHKELIRIVKENYTIFNASRLALGNALVELHDGNYWKDTHTTFRDYCQDNFSISDNYARRLMEGIKVISDLPKNLQSRISNEAQARALAGVPEEDRTSAVKEASKNGHVTAKSIGEAAAKIEENKNIQNVPIGTLRVSAGASLNGGRRDKTVLYDKIGIPVPDDAIPYWNRRQEVQELLDKISDIKCAIEKAKNGGDAMYANVSNNFIVDMRNAYVHIKDGAVPYAVCTQCMGTPSMQKDGCSFCKNTGLIPEWKWNTQAMKEVKEMRIKIAADLAAGKT